MPNTDDKSLTDKKATSVPPRASAKGKRPPAGKPGAPRNPGPRRASAVRAQHRRRRNLIAAAAVGVVVVVIAVVVIVGIGKTNAKPTPRTPVPAATSAHLQSVPLGDLVAASAKFTDLQPATQLPAGTPPLTSGGKPEFLFIGAEFCPICATERWPMTVALSQFGKFTNLSQIRSAVKDGNIATLSYYGSSYSSPYLTFTPVEAYTNIPQGSFYKPLQPLTAEQTALWQQTLGGTESFPFLYLGGKYALATSQIPDTTLSGESFDSIANQVGNNDTDIGVKIDSAAASMVKYICGMTNGQPGSVCQKTANINAPVSQAASSGPSSSNG